MDYTETKTFTACLWVFLSEFLHLGRSQVLPSSLLDAVSRNGGERIQCVGTAGDGRAFVIWVSFVNTENTFIAEEIHLRIAQTYPQLLRMEITLDIKKESRLKHILFFTDFIFERLWIIHSCSFCTCVSFPFH